MTKQNDQQQDQHQGDNHTDKDGFLFHSLSSRSIQDLDDFNGSRSLLQRV